MGHDVFISHSSRDKAVADAICNALENAGIRCWIAPRDLIAGRPFSGEIIRGIKACRVMVLLFSSHSNASPEVLREVQLATTHRLHLVNFRIEDSRVNDDLAYFLGIPHWLDAINEPMLESHAKLVESVRALLALPPKDVPPEQAQAAAEATRAGTPLPAGRNSPRPWLAGAAAAVLLAGAGFYFLHDRSKTETTSGGNGTKPPAESTPPPAEPPSSADISERFAALTGSPAIIAAPKTPEQHYRNARLHEVAGNIGAARQEYAAYLASDLEMLDPWLQYSSMLKIQEGREGALENMRTIAGQSKTISYQIAIALLQDREPRLTKLLALQKEHPDYGPLLYLISQEYSEAKRGDATLAEKRSEREWLEKFRAAKNEGHLVKYFLDKKEVQKWFDDADARTAKLNSIPAVTMPSPVKVLVTQSNSGWSATLILSDFKVKELFYKLDGKGDFVSTGHQPFTNPQTGLPMVRMDVPLPGLSEGEHTMEVQYQDLNDQINGPYTEKFSLASAALAQAKQSLAVTAASWLSFRDFDGKVWLYFTGILSYRPALQEIRYSVDNESLDQKFEFEPSKIMGPPGDKISVFVPAATTFACVQLTYKDGTKSPLQRFERKK